jgi:DNA-binding transcriptional MerR regulator
MKMKKSFLDELKEHKEKTDSRRRGVVAVLARREEIEQGLEAGFTLNDIYTVLSDKGQMPVSYSAFVKLVRKYIKGKEKSKTKMPKGAREALKKDEEKKPRPFNPDNHDPEKLW